MYCLYCGKRLPLIRLLSGAGEYCSEGHRDRHVEDQSKAAMARQENIINPMTPEASAAFFKSELERYAVIVKRANITLD